MSSLFVEVWGHSGGVSLSHFTSDLLRSLGIASSCESGLNEEDRAHEISDLVVFVDHISIGVESENFRIFIKRKSIKVVVHGFKSAFWGSVIHI
jgi:hypothetical protein